MPTAPHIRQARGRKPPFALPAVVGVLVIATAATTVIQTCRVGESGARAAWGRVTSSAP